jgi:opacity protein-like surface antigen
MIKILKVTGLAAVEVAVPEAVKAAVAEKEGQRATAQSLADSWYAQAKLADSKKWEMFGWGIGAGVASAIAAGVVAILLAK